eukprot:COSAG01_NODE_318_length_18932_cov_26.063983_13_plen_63_part_00
MCVLAVVQQSDHRSRSSPTMHVNSYSPAGALRKELAVSASPGRQRISVKGGGAAGRTVRTVD